VEAEAEAEHREVGEKAILFDRIYGISGIKTRSNLVNPVILSN
jgi:hypothetical protein